MTTTSLTSGSLSAPAAPYRRWALILLGALLLIALGTLTTVDRAPAAPPAEAQELTLGGILTLEQPFSTSRPQLAGVAIRIRPGSAADTALQLPIRLRYADGPPVDLVQQSLPLSAAEDGLLSFRFPAPIQPRDPFAVTETLRLIIDVPELPPSSGPLIAAQSSAAGQGRLQIDNAVASGLDLVIIPLYQRRWADSVWPISAMAAGKPGPLGWPPLYLLGPYLYIVALAAGARALRQEFTP